MKHLTDADILRMADSTFMPNITDAKAVVRDLHLSKRIPAPPQPVPKHATLDLHQKTEEQARQEIMNLATSGVRRATIITGASGILKIKFQQWARDSILAPNIISLTPLNNGSFDVRFKKH